jgi:hypothetical protein
MMGAAIHWSVVKALVFLRLYLFAIITMIALGGLAVLLISVSQTSSRIASKMRNAGTPWCASLVYVYREFCPPVTVTTHAKIPSHANRVLVCRTRYLCVRTTLNVAKKLHASLASAFPR